MREWCNVPPTDVHSLVTGLWEAGLVSVSCPPGREQRGTQIQNKAKSCICETYLFYLDVKFTVDLSSPEDLHPECERRNPVVVCIQTKTWIWWFCTFLLCDWQLTFPPAFAEHLRILSTSLASDKEVSNTWNKLNINGTKSYFPFVFVAVCCILLLPELLAMHEAKLSSLCSIILVYHLNWT